MSLKIPDGVPEERQVGIRNLVERVNVHGVNLSVCEYNRGVTKSLFELVRPHKGTGVVRDLLVAHFILGDSNKEVFLPSSDVLVGDVLQNTEGSHDQPFKGKRRREIASANRAIATHEIMRM